ncbi:MAG: anthraniloyl-CoA monooxygenase [Chloroflexota bacterium]|jgi:anthraniloyl-CoA monooxygenase|nr:anthraniloyl-CoA monooxygenase [Chloroflexota bacterium]
MSGLRVAVIGGGPAGLCFARLLKMQAPESDVTVFERLPPGGTYGYGVGLGHRALGTLRDADPQLREAIEEAAITVDTWTLQRDGQELSATNSHGIAISRAELLALLQEHARAVGVKVETGGQTSLADVKDADLIVAADGSGSGVRGELAGDLGASVSRGELAYLWCGVPISVPAMTLSIAQTADGPLTAHVMPYSAGASTFQVDAPRGVLAAMEKSFGPGAESEQLAHLEAHYQHLLAGQHLEIKRFEWATFPTVTCEAWSAGKTVLIGDAAHTAHYTVGSGTGLAIEDAVALAAAVRDAGSMGDAFGAYEAMRRPRVTQLQSRAAISERWWSTLDLRRDLPLARVLVSYLTRTGAVTLPMLVAQNQPLLESALGSSLRTVDAAAVAESILAQPYMANGRSLPGRRFVPPATDDATATIEVKTAQPTLAELRSSVDRVAGMRSQGVSHVRLVGPDDRVSLYARLELAEHLRARTELATVVSGPREASDDLALGVLSGRTDLVEIEG